MLEFDCYCKMFLLLGDLNANYFKKITCILYIFIHLRAKVPDIQ